MLWKFFSLLRFQEGKQAVVRSTACLHVYFEALRSSGKIGQACNHRDDLSHAEIGLKSWINFQKPSLPALHFLFPALVKAGLGSSLNKKCPFRGFLFWRRERDSNPRRLAPQRFSRPPHSTALPSLRGKNTRRMGFSKKTFLSVWFYDGICCLHSAVM